MRRAERLPPRAAVASLALCALLAAGCDPAADAPDRAGSGSAADLIVRGGTLVDGTGAPPRRADVAVRGGRIAAVGILDGWTADRELDAAGAIVAPGFVDLHGHADLILLADPERRDALLEAKLRQGVTTLIVGNCGLGVAPAGPEAAGILAGVNAWMTPEGLAAGPLDVAGFLDRLAAAPLPLHAGTLVPHGPVRVDAMGLAAGAPDDAQLAAMRAAVARGLDAGAFGLSVGLIYPPGMFSSTDELVALAGEVAARDRVLTAHVRGSSELLLPATRELIEIARRSGARAHHSHLEAVGEAYWPDAARALALEDAARAEGLALTHDVFPYTRAATMMSAIFPPWSLEGGVPALLDRLRDPAARARIRADIETRAPEWPPWVAGGWPHNLVRAVGWDGIRVARLPAGLERDDLLGRSLAEIASGEGSDPFDVVADLMLAADGRVGQWVDEISGVPGRTGALEAILRHPAAAVIADAEDYGLGDPHPAHAGAFARALRWNRERSWMSLQELVRKMTGAPAAILGLTDRGTVAEGRAADLVVFDPGRVADRAGWDRPRLRAVGFRWVLVAGEVAVENDGRTAARAGRVLRAGPGVDVDAGADPVR